MARRAIVKLATFAAFSAFALMGSGVAAEAFEGRTAQIATAPSEALIEIPFAPPAGEVFIYTAVFDKYSNDAGDDHFGPTKARQSLSFMPDGDGFLMTFQTLSAEGEALIVTANSTISGMMFGTQMAVREPIKVELSQNGEPVRVTNWQTIKARLEPVPAAIARGVPKAYRPEVEEGAAKRLAPLLQADENTAFSALVKAWPVLLGWGGTQVETDTLLEFSQEVQSPVAPVMIPQNGTMTLIRDAEGNIVLEIRSTTPPGAIRESAEQYFGPIRDAARTNKQRFADSIMKVYEELENGSISQHTQIVFDGKTGVIRSALLEKELVGRSLTGGERTTISLVE